MLKIVRVKGSETPPSATNLLVGFSLFTATLFIAVVATYPSFFLFNPFASNDGWRSICLLLTNIGWISAILGPIIIMALINSGKDGALRFLPWIALAWPASLVVNHVSLLLQTQKLFIGYLVVYPIFIITDIALPLLYVALYRYLKHHPARWSVGLTHGKHQQEEVQR